MSGGVTFFQLPPPSVERKKDLFRTYATSWSQWSGSRWVSRGRGLEGWRDAWSSQPTKGVEAGTSGGACDGDRAVRSSPPRPMALPRSGPVAHIREDVELTGKAFEPWSSSCAAGRAQLPLRGAFRSLEYPHDHGDTPSLSTANPSRRRIPGRARSTTSETLRPIRSLKPPDTSECLRPRSVTGCSVARIKENRDYRSPNL